MAPTAAGPKKKNARTGLTRLWPVLCFKHEPFTGYEKITALGTRSRRRVPSDENGLFTR